MEEFIAAISQVGFPIVVAVYLMVRIEKRQSENTTAINKLTDKIEKLLYILEKNDRKST